MSRAKRYVLVGTGGRSTTFIDAIVRRHAQHSSLAAMCDLSQKRMDWQNLRLRELYKAGSIDTFPADQFERLIRKIKPEDVVVCTAAETATKATDN